MVVRPLLLLVIYISCLTVLAIPLNYGVSSRRADPIINPTAPSPSPCVLTTNADISGIGVRISFYAQSLIAILAPRILDVEEIGTIFRNALLTSVALDISALIQKGNPGVLSVIDGLLATFFPFLLAIGTTFHIVTLLRSNVLVKVSYLIQVVIVNVFSIIFWVQVHSFGSFEGCNINSTAQFLVFSHSFSMTSKGLRIVCIFISASAMNPFLFALFRTHKGVNDRDDDSVEELLGWKIATWAWTCLPLGGWIYCVVTIEHILHRNGLASTANQWTYGQTLSVVLLANTVVDITVAGYRKRKSKNGSSSASQIATQADLKAEEAEAQVDNAK